MPTTGVLVTATDETVTVVMRINTATSAGLDDVTQAARWLQIAVAEHADAKYMTLQQMLHVSPDGGTVLDVTLSVVGGARGHLGVLAPLEAPQEEQQRTTQLRLPVQDCEAARLMLDVLGMQLMGREHGEASFAAHICLQQMQVSFCRIAMHASCSNLRRCADFEIGGREKWDSNQSADHLRVSLVQQCQTLRQSRLLLFRSQTFLG